MYFNIRLTPGVIFALADVDKPTKESLRFCKQIIAHIQSKYDIAISSFSYEVFNKLGEPCHPHFHFFFEEVGGATKGAIAKMIVRYSEQLGHKLSGNKMYALCVDEEPDDVNRWLRYPLKQLKSDKKPNKKFSKFPENFDVSLQIKMANDEYERTSKKLRELRDSKLKKLTFYDKIVKHLEKKELKDLKEIHIEIQKFYISEKKPVNYSTIDGYTITYMLSKDLMSPEEGFNKYSRIK